MKQDSAEAIALRVLAWLVENDELLPVFLGSTGIDGAGLRGLAQDPALHTAVLDFLMMDDAWVQSCAQDTGLDPRDPMRARMALPGGEQVNWT